MQRYSGNNVGAARRKIMWRRVRPILPHTSTYEFVSHRSLPESS
jgi:hypothetical protein